jgi:hypothetical protein
MDASKQEHVDGNGADRSRRANPWKGILDAARWVMDPGVETPANSIGMPDYVLEGYYL